MKIKWCAVILLVGILLLSSVACGTGLDYVGSDLSITTKALPSWIEGTYGSVTLNATGGTGVKTWRGTPPEPWVLSPSGVISGTAPLLGTSLGRTYPPFTVTVIDEERHAREATYTISVIKSPPQITPNPIEVTWEEGFSPSGILHLGTISEGVPPYRMAIPGGFGIPLGMSVGINEDGVSLQLKGPPPKADFEVETHKFQVSIVDSNFAGATADVILTVVRAEPVEEVFEGTFSGVFGTSSGSQGCQWSTSFSGTMTLTLVQNSDGTVSGTAEVPTEIVITTIYTPPSVSECGHASPFTRTATGTVSGTSAGLTGTFVSEGERPLEVVFTGARNGNRITGSITVSKTFEVFRGGVLESTPSFSTTVPVVLVKQR